MTSKLISHALCLLCLFWSAATTLSAEEPAPAVEKAKIEALISHIEGLENATFVRNGSDYSAANAAKFLRAKWARHEKEVKTAADFIAKVASASGTSGKSYMIRFNDGKETPCGDYLTAQLKKL
ncbi:MAG: DUF5329 domain-containing protein [Prosthecobacter sp.]|uniref:DUF5329 family protein n=1 Tax=Prosthecobacter sp. TaxID=1965333 RepID=UPI0025E36098|nr:DUF5329 family protein [Prosthecobacter sp.]MCF7787017.1 DUF5329 domain-containing protein [Prosthecobacter sp.]